MASIDPNPMFTDDKLANIRANRYKQYHTTFSEFENDSFSIKRIGRVKIEIKDGLVRLSGYVDADSQRDSIESLAKTIPGVLNIVNEITVSPTHIFWE